MAVNQFTTIEKDQPVKIRNQSIFRLVTSQYAKLIICRSYSSLYVSDSLIFTIVFVYFPWGQVNIYISDHRLYLLTILLLVGGRLDCAH